MDPADLVVGVGTIPLAVQSGTDFPVIGGRGLNPLGVDRTVAGRSTRD